MSPYYKAVMSYDTRRASVIAVDEPGKTKIKTEITYFPFEWVGATWQMSKFGYHPTAFTHLDYAQRFANGSPGVEIWRCRIQERVWDLPQMLDIPALQKYAKIVPHRKQWPVGTIMAKKIMLTERVE